MITVERKRTYNVPAERIRAIIGDVEQLGRLIPRTERVDVLAQGENRARIAVVLRLSRLGTQRIEGEARLLEDGVRFVAVQPMQIDARWLVQSHGETTEVIARLVSELPKKLASFARLIPQRLIEERVGAELEAALDALEAVIAEANKQG